MPKRCRFERAPPFPRYFGIHRPMRGRPLFWEYEDLPVEAEEFWGFRYNRKKRIEHVRLDTIKVAGCLLINIIINLLMGTNWLWAAAVAQSLNPQADPHTWCGWKGTGIPFSPADHAKTTTHLNHLADLHELREADVMEECDLPNTENRMFFSFFKVLKACKTVARAIANCKVMSSYFNPPPPMRLITPKDLFRLMAFFRRPKFCELDFRHWFYQIPLPNRVRHWFTTKCGESFFQLKVWPMGFKWTPAIAQGISMMIAAEAIRRAGYIPRSPLADDTEIPPYWIVLRSAQDTIPIAFMVVYYDNVLTIADSSPVRDALHKSFAVTCGVVAAEIKSEDESLAPHDRITDWDEGEVPFLGVHFRTENQQVWWKHADVGKWAHLNPREPTITRAEVAEIVGVIIWHWTLTNAKLAAIRHVLRVASKIGKVCESKSDWLQQADLTEDEARALENSLKQVREAGVTEQLYLFEVTYFHEVVCAASDSSNDKGAAMYFNVPLEALINDLIWEDWCRENNSLESSYRSWWWNWEAQEREESINRKEIWAALDVIDLVIIWKMICNNPTRFWLVPIAVDNTTAVSAISNWFFPADEELGTQLEWRHQMCEELGIVVLPVQVMSEEEAADDNTRGRKSDPSRRLLTLNRLRWAMNDMGLVVME